MEKVVSFIELATKAGAGQDLSSLKAIDCPEPVVSALGNVMQAITAAANKRYSIIFDLSLVRGMGYYTGQIFEIVGAGQAHLSGRWWTL